MSEVEGGATLAWRLLATLEGSSLVLATSALLAYSLRKRVASAARVKRPRRPVRTVMLTNTTSTLGQELKTRLELRGCVVTTVPSGADSGTESGTESRRVDALIVVGAGVSNKHASLQAIANLVNDDVYHNLKALEALAPHVHRGGRVAWACAGEAAGSFHDAGDAFDTVIEANLRRVAQIWHCEAVWVGRGSSEQRAAELVVAALLLCDEDRAPGFSIRHTANKIGEYVGRWFKIVT